MTQPLREDFPPLFLIPCLLGVRSRRHHFLLRRTEQLVGEARAAVESIENTPGAVMTVEQAEFIRDRLLRMRPQIEEVLVYLLKHERRRMTLRAGLVVYDMTCCEDAVEKALR
ncbi:uncharacterized protein SETTUDRAFT_35938 [Exserohilum turcica Et28A]|uniref:Uncharacterized protein n=1 Tax=Exserohilum turcicum (strain 28A) TaxID=671987 RepID=R0JI75_EXST2|nr:uncharacterized protein SETTUDRAFT_35938 [Exserohilum turcica Et28A]EOA81058.1 hypothetical protein SETTUDRAFT_35938 [Exserohilum turcica Et28A]